MNRPIKFRAWDGEKMWNENHIVVGDGVFAYGSHKLDENLYYYSKVDWTPMQFTGLRDKNGVTEVYEGDIIDIEGNIIGNIYESPQIHKEGVTVIIEGMGTSTWRNTESVAMGRGCKYAE